MVQVYGILTDPTGRPLQRQRVVIRSVTPGNPFTSEGSAIAQVATVDTDTDGRWDVDLIPSSGYEFAGQYYTADWRDTPIQQDAFFGFTVPDSGGPLNFRDHLVDPLPPGTPIPPVTAHSLADHTDVDLTGLADGDVLTYVLADGKWESAPAGSGPGGGVTDVTAADATIVIGGTSTSPTVRVNGAALTGVPQAAVTGLVSALAAKYEKPGTGIPAADLNAAVAALLDAAGTAVQPGALALVAFSGAYADLTGAPALAPVATSGAYSDLTGRPALAPVATSGAYADLTGKPTIPATPGDIGAQPADSDLTAIAGLAPADGAVIRRTAGSWGAATLTKGDVGLSNVDNTADAAKPVSTATATALAGKQDADADLTAIAGLAPADGAVIRRSGGAWTGAVLAKADVGLGNVDNTADSAKPVSTAQQAALDARQPLDSDLTAIAGLAPSDDSVLQRKAGAWTGRTPAQLKADLSLTKSDVGLSNVDNTSDASKPISTATATALAGKQDLPGAGVDLDAWLTTFDTNITSGQAYTDPTSGEVTTFLQGLEAVARGATSDAGLASLGFTITTGIEALTKRAFALVYNESGTARAWGAYLVDMSRPRWTGLIEAPHPVFDSGSEFMALQQWRDIPGCLLLISGSHRTDTTGTNPRDSAHNTSSLFHQVALHYLGYRLPQFSQHGYADATDPTHDLVVSSGSANDVPALHRIADALELAGFVVARSWVDTGNPLLGTTNVQGIAAGAAGAPFVHIEVNNTVRTTPALLDKYEKALTVANYFGTVADSALVLADAITGQFPSSVGSANSAGTAPNPSRSDHVHRLTTNTPSTGHFVMRLSGAWTATDGVAALTDAATITTDASTGEVFTVTLAGNRTLANPTNSRDGMKRTWRFRQDVTGGRTITLGSNFALGSNVPNTTLTGTAGKVGYLTALYDSTAARWHVLAFEPGA